MHLSLLEARSKTLKVANGSIVFGTSAHSQASRTKLLAGTAEHVKQTEESSDSTPFKYRTLPETMWGAQLSHSPTRHPLGSFESLPHALTPW